MAGTAEGVLLAQRTARLNEARGLTDDLFALLRPDALYERPIAERHRLIFYLGHLDAFDWNLICRGAGERESFHPTFDRLFAFGIDPVNGNLPSDQPSDWPSVHEVETYNRRVRDIVDRDIFADRLDDGLLFNVAVEHRLMHAETLSYLLHRLPAKSKSGPHDLPMINAAPVQPHRVAIPEGDATMGLRRDADTFGWDNEFEVHTVHVPAFSIDAYNVTNGQYLEYMNATNAGPPSFWIRRDAAWFYRTMFAEIPLPLDWPVYVSHADASAYAKWKGLALPTEGQFHRAALGAKPGNADFRHWDPVPVGAYPECRSKYGVYDLVGNGWEWTSTLFEPFPGFTAFPFYAGYSADFFDGKHYVLKGGSARTAACMLRPSFRNWFQPNYPYIYSTFRCVEN